MLGAFLSFFALAQNFGIRLLFLILSERNSRLLDDWVARFGGGAPFVRRLTTVIAFNLINYAACLARGSWWTFAWTTEVGILPVTVLMVAMGAQVASLPWFLWLLILASGALVWIVLHRLCGPPDCQVGT